MGAVCNQGLTEAWGRFLFIFNEFDVFEQTPALGVLSLMKDGSVGIGSSFTFYEFRWLDQSQSVGDLFETEHDMNPLEMLNSFENL